MKAREYLLVVCCLSCCLFVGCQGVQEKGGMLEREAANARLTSHQLRVMVNEFVVHFAGRIELTADRILANTSDPAIRRNALLWKINGLSSCFQAASRPEPLGAYLDIWILNRQTIHLLESPAGGQLFGPLQSVAVDECHALDRRLFEINRALNAEVHIGEQFVMKFAADYPLTSLYFDREPIASRYIEEVQEPAKELFQVVANLDDNVDDLKKLTVLYAEHLPKLARWEAELFLIDSMQLAVVQQPIQDFSQAAGAVSRIAHVTETMPHVVERERHALREIVSSERQQTLNELDRMRESTVQQLAGEREIVLDAIREERVAVLEALRAERRGVGDELRAETAKVLQATDAITKRRTEELLQQAPQVIDHFFWRVCQLAFIFALLALASTWLFLRKRKQLAPSSPQLTMVEHDQAA